MMPERWRQLEEIYHAASEKAAEDRRAYLDTACGGDGELRREVESLLARDREAEGFLESRMPEQPTVTMMLGAQIGPYRILTVLGKGGMGEVYRAHDSKLGRDVALKVLPKNFAQDAERLARFRREARTLASLNHPNIATIYGLEESGEETCLVLELVDGETLRGPLPVAKVLEYARQIVEGLEAAHRKGIVHRDLKPANIKVTPEGRVKILDFGLAKAVWGSDEKPLPDSKTATQYETVAGRIVGTPGYMSPEQARGQEIDQRTDIWAFGCLLYELLTGKRVFCGETLEDTISAVLEREPDWNAVPAKTPAKVRDLLRRCLEKDARRRLPKIEDARRAIEELQRRTRRWPLAIAAAVVLLVVGAFAWMRSSGGPADLSRWMQITRLPDSVTQPALSADGKMLAFLRGTNTFIGESELYVKLLPDGDPVQITHDKTRKMSPVFSPDGSRIAYTVLGPNSTWDTWTVPAFGGTPALWLPNAAALTWTGQQHILFSEIKTGQHMAIISALENRAGSRDVYVPPHEFGMAHRSYLSPDGRWVLIVEMNEVSYWLPCRLAPYEGSSPGKPVGPQGLCTSAAWSPDGKWMYFSAAAAVDEYHIWRQRFPDGKPEQITSGPTQEEGIAVSPDGQSLITAVALRQRPVWFHDRSGDHQISLQGYGSSPRLDMQNRKLYYRVNHGVATRQSGELWVSDLDSGRNEPVLPGFVVSNFDISDDGRLVAAVRDARGKARLWVAPVDRTSPPRQIPGVESSWVLAGQPGELFYLASEGGKEFLYRILDDGSGPRKVTSEAIMELHSISPDRQWVVGYRPSDAGAGAVEFAFSTGGQPSIALCSQPCMVHWSSDGGFLFFSIPEGWLNLLAGGRTYILPTAPGSDFPELPPGGFKSEAEIAAVPGVRVIDAADIGPGPSADVYAFSREVVQRNLYRIPLR
jgi:serine/threonine protein kinase/Tol biopolymer transport system component